jgi:hypothetical protein
LLGQAFSAEQGFKNWLGKLCQLDKAPKTGWASFISWTRLQILVGLALSAIRGTKKWLGKLCQLDKTPKISRASFVS